MKYSHTNAQTKQEIRKIREHESLTLLPQRANCFLSDQLAYLNDFSQYTLPVFLSRINGALLPYTLIGAQAYHRSFNYCNVQNRLQFEAKIILFFPQKNNSLLR